MKFEIKYGNNAPENKSSDYMIAEFEALHHRAILQEQIISNKINFFLAVTTATAGGIIIASDTDFLKPYILSACVVILIFLFAVGWVTFIQVLDLLSSSIFFYRRVGRIRKWFLDNDGALLKYMPFSVGDDSPSYYTPHSSLRGVESILLLINAAILAVVTVLFTWLVVNWVWMPQTFLYIWIPHVISISIGIPLFFLTWFYQLRFTKKYLQDKEKRELELGRVYFPRDMPFP